jgi:DNA-binding beta-propeller fold protein YncE
MMKLTLWPLALAFAACTADPDDDTVLDTDPPTTVLADCAPETGRICPLFGTGDAGYNGEDLPALESWMSQPMSVTFSPYGDPIIADWNNHKLRRVMPDGTLHTIMGTAFLGDGDFEGRDMADGAQGTEVNLNHPTQQQYFSSGLLLSASWHTHKLRTWDPFTGVVHVIMGSAYGFAPLETEPAGEDQSAVGTQLNQPRWVQIDKDQNVYIVDMRNERIRKLDMENYLIKTVAGSGGYGVVGTAGWEADRGCDDTDALNTCFAFPRNQNPIPGGAIQFNEDESLMYIADSEANIIRVLDMTTNLTSILAGAAGEKGDEVGPGATARFSFPSSIAIDNTTHTLFVADTDNHKVKAIDLVTGEVSLIAGTGDPTCDTQTSPDQIVVCPEQHRAGDGGSALDATLFRPFGVDLDLDGNLVIADTYNHRFRVVYR